MIKTAENQRNWNREVRRKKFEEEHPHGRMQRYHEKYPNRIMNEDLKKLEVLNDETP